MDLSNSMTSKIVAFDNRTYHFEYFSQNPCKFRILFVSLHRRLLALMGKAGGLIYEKDVFERLSL